MFNILFIGRRRYWQIFKSALVLPLTKLGEFRMRNVGVEVRWRHSSQFNVGFEKLIVLSKSVCFCC